MNEFTKTRESKPLLNVTPYYFDINRDDLYEYDKPRERTEKRLKEMAGLGMEEVCIAQFGIKNVFSGLYIEMVWSLSDKDFEDYLLWVKDRIASNSAKQKQQT